MSIPRKLLRRLQSTNLGDEVLLRDLYIAIDILGVTGTSIYYTYSGGVQTLREVFVQLGWNEAKIFRSLTKLERSAAAKPVFCLSCVNQEGISELAVKDAKENELFNKVKVTPAMLALFDRLLKHKDLYEKVNANIAALQTLQRKHVADEEKRAEIYAAIGHVTS